MNLLWLPVLRPLCKALAPDVIVEIGADTGLNTRNVLSYCSYFGAALYSIDPAPKFDAAEWERQYGHLFHFFPTTSAEALPQIPKFDLVLADGDHNYHTVYQELKLIEKLTREHAQAFPCIVCHDIGWPYARRDLYYNPEALPADARKPYARKGIKMNQSELAESGGLNPHLHHRTVEGGPQNGVLTAVEDFLKESEIHFDVIKIPSLYGLGILIPEELKARNPRMKEFAAAWRMPEHLEKLVDATEQNRLQAEINYHEHRAKYQQLLERVKSFENNTQALKDTIRARDEAAGQLRAELEETRAEQEKAVRTLKIRGEENQALYERVLKLKESNQNLEKLVAAEREKGGAMRGELEQARLNAAEAGKLFQEKTAEHEATLKKLARKMEVAAEWSQRATALEEELRESRAELEASGAQLAQLRQEVDDARGELLAREQRAAQLASAIEELERQTAQRESARQELNRLYKAEHAARMTLQCEAQAHDEQLDALKRRIYAAELGLAAEKSQTVLLREELARQQGRVAADAEERDRLDRLARELEETLNDRTRALADLESTHTALAATLAEQQATIAGLESQLQSQQVLLCQRQDEVDALWQELFAMEGRLTDERTARTEAEEMLELAFQDLESYDQQIQAIQARVDREFVSTRDVLRAERDQLMQELEISRRDQAESQMELEALNRKLTELASRQSEWEAQKRSGEKRIAKLTDRVIARDQQLHEYEHRWKEERAKGGHLQSQKQLLEQKMAELTQAQKELRSQLRAATRKIGEYEDQIQRMKNRPAWRLFDLLNRSTVLTKSWITFYKGLSLLIPSLRPAARPALPAAPGESTPAPANVKAPVSAASHGASNGKSAPAANGKTAPAADLARIHGTIVVCVRDALEDVKACLESLRRHTDLKKHRLLLVDDGSDQATRALMERFHKETGVAVLSTPANARGYTRAANVGIRASSGDFVILLNSDTIVPAGWIERMVACAFSAPDIAVVGPLSNAASWQSIPELRDAEGKWCINKLPDGVSVDEYARSIAEHSPRLYPEVTFVNGFCYLITRRAIEKVGLLDEQNFPMGYGEEDDFSFRSQQAGMRCLIADDAYVFHAKSKSFTAEVRAKIVETAKPKLANKHGRDLIKKQIERIATNEALLRARVMARIMAEQGTRGPLQRRAKRAQTIGWIQPHLGTVGGIRRVIEMSNRLVQWGHRVFLVTPDGEKTTWLPIQANVITFEKARQMRFDCLMVSDPDVVDLFHEMPAPLKINYHLAAYMVYREKTERLGLYYNHDRAVVHLANSHWTAEQIESSFGDIKVAAVLPGGIDKMLFHPVRTPVQYDLVYYGSKRKHKGTPTIVTAAKSLKMNGLSLSTLGATQEELAQHICSGRIFASACWHEGFNFCPLEAMACGVPVVMTDDGGSREYARHGENALVVPPQDEVAFAQALAQLHKDQDLRLKFIEQGLETAYKYNWDDITVELADIIEQRLR